MFCNMFLFEGTPFASDLVKITALRSDFAKWEYPGEHFRIASRRVEFRRNFFRGDGPGEGDSGGASVPS